jgi:ABC-type multidrug transport system permease subunit
LLVDQLRFSTVDLWRTRVVFVFTFLFPLTWLVLLGALAGNAVVDPATGLRVMQYVSPLAAVMGVLYSTLPTMAASLAIAREQGTLKRIRGTPLPTWVYLGGRIGAAVLFAVGSVTTMLLVAVVFYDVQIIWRTVPATVVTIVLAIGCFTAAGMAIAGVSRSAGVAQAASVATAVVLGFISGLFIVGTALPEWVDRVAGIFPLKAFAQTIQHQFNPYHAGAGWDLGALALLLGWGVFCGVVAVRTFRWDPARERSAAARKATAPSVPQPETRSQTVSLAQVRRATVPEPSAWQLIGGQVRHAVAQATRDPGSVFFAVAMPAGLFALLMATIAPNAGEGVGVSLAAGMSTWGAAVTAFINMPEAVMRDRDRGVLKRLRGTPLRPGLYLAGRTVSAVLIAELTAAVIWTIGALGFDISFSPTGVVVGAVLLAAGTVVFALCGIALAAALPSSKAVTAVGLAILLPLAFFSDVFLIGGTPAWMSTIGSLLPMKPLANSLTAALDPGASQLQWGALAVMMAWLLIGAVLTARRFRSWAAMDDSPRG